MSQLHPFPEPGSPLTQDPTRVVRLALLNDQPVVLAGLAALLTAPGSVFDLRQVTTTLADLDDDVDVVLFDSFGSPGVAARVEELLAHTRAAIVLFSATAPPSGTVNHRVRYLSKGANGPELVAGILAAVAGRDPAAVASPSSTPGTWPGQVHGLTLRESEVLALIASGLSNVDVASALFLGVNTVKTYIRAAYRKAGVTSRSTAVLWALSHGFDGSV